MPDLLPGTCLVLVVALVVTSVGAFVWSVIAGVPAAAYGAMAAF
jgi:hypothetical protein